MKNQILTIVLSIFAGTFLIAMIGKKVLTSPYKISAQEQAALVLSLDSQFSLFDLAISIKSKDPNILLIDVRNEIDFSKGRLPNAINVPLEKLLHKDYSEYITGSERITRVFYGKTEADAIKAISILAMRGLTGYKYLNGGYSIANQNIVKSSTPSFYHYRDEQKKFNYGKLMPAGSASASEAPTEEIGVDVSVPRGGC